MFLLDTVAISEIRKIRSRRCDPGVMAWAYSVEAAYQLLSAISVQELELGAALAERKDPAKGALLRHWLTTKVLSTEGPQILPVTAAIAQRSGHLHAVRTRSAQDALIAATAYIHGLTVVTRNVRDFEDTGVEILNPWSS